MTLEPLEELSEALFSAIGARDIARILNLKAQGARLDVTCPKAPKMMLGAENAPLTPAGYAAIKLEWKADDLEILLGRGNEQVPAAAVLEDGTRPNLYEAIGLVGPAIDYEMVLARLKYCYDRTSPEVNAAMWDGAIAAAGQVSKATDFTAEVDFGFCASQILRQGAFGASGQKYAELLALPTSRSKKEGAFLRFVDEPVCADKQVLTNWLANGLSPNLDVEGMPLLHYMAINNQVEAIRLLLDAGANPAATCSYERLDERLDRQQRAYLALFHKPVTALESARDARAQEAVQAIEAYMAKCRIDAVLAAAKKTREP